MKELSKMSDVQLLREYAAVCEEERRELSMDQSGDLHSVISKTFESIYDKFNEEFDRREIPFEYAENLVAIYDIEQQIQLLESKLERETDRYLVDRIEYELLSLRQYRDSLESELETPDCPPTSI